MYCIWLECKISVNETLFGRNTNTDFIAKLLNEDADTVFTIEKTIRKAHIYKSNFLFIDHIFLDLTSKQETDWHL